MPSRAFVIVGTGARAPSDPGPVPDDIPQHAFPVITRERRSRPRFGSAGRRATVTVSLIDQRWYRVEHVSGPLGLPVSSWYRDDLLAETSEAGWRLQRQEPLPDGNIRMHFGRRRPTR
jgi:hypothetical protein